MGKYIEVNRSLIEAFTFEEIKEYAKNNSIEPHWSFEFKGRHFSHENDNAYCFADVDGYDYWFGENNIIIYNELVNTLHLIDVELFYKSHILVE